MSVSSEIGKPNMFSVKVHLREELQASKSLNTSQGGINEEATSGATPSVEILHGTVHLFRDVSIKPSTSVADLPGARNENLCVLGVPSVMTTLEFLQFTSSFTDSIKTIRFIWNDDSADRQIVLLNFDSQASADAFYKFCNGKSLPIEEVICHVLFADDIHCTSSSEEASEAPAGLTEIPTCPVCLERLDEHISGILTTTVLDTSSIFSPRDSSCLVCRYCTQPEKSSCSVCPTCENLWVCVICGFVGCGRYQAGHAIKHWKETKHCYSLELESQRVWDYVGDSYVHRIIQSKTDGNLVELTAPSNDSNDDCSSCECSRGPEPCEPAYDSKLQALEYEYKSLLASQFESQRKYYEERLVENEQKGEADITAAVEKVACVKLQKLKQTLDKIEGENKFLKQVNQCLSENEEAWQKKYRDSEERGELLLQRRDHRTSDLEQQVQRLMECLEGSKSTDGNAINSSSKPKAHGKHGRKRQ